MKFVNCALMLAILAGPSAHAACVYPKAPENIPDGSTAKLEEMLAAQKALKAYNDDIKAYTDCLQQEYDETVAREGDKLSPENKEAMKRIQIDKNDAAVAEAEAVTARFNEQVRIFKARDNKKKS